MLKSDYSTNKKVAEQAIAPLVPNWPEAVKRAEQVRKHHEAARTPHPANPSTEVATLLRALDDSLPERQRRLNVAK